MPQWTLGHRASLLLGVPEKVVAIDAFVRRMRMKAPPVVFFRGQLLELARWIAAKCTNQPDDPHTFERKPVRSAFVRAALIASDLWSRVSLAAVLPVRATQRPSYGARSAHSPAFSCLIT